MDAYRPRIVAFLCNWCSYAGADLAGTTRIKHRADVRIIRVPCSGRVDACFVLKAFERGADAVIVGGCHPGDCHYVAGNLNARRRFLVLRYLMGFLGIDPDRFQAVWCSAAEGDKWARTVNEVCGIVERLGPLEAFHNITRDVTKPEKGMKLSHERAASGTQGES
jgi:F420-non-reducing hydrogenase iron-sulfur subunit